MSNNFLDNSTGKSAPSDSSNRNAQQEEEIALVKKAQHDLQSFAVLYETYFDKIYRYFHFRLRNDLDAEDLTSLTFEKAVTKLHTFQDKGYPFATWLFRVAHNVLIDFFRKNAKFSLSSIDDLAPQEEPHTENKPLFIDEIDQNTDLDKIKQIIKTLPPLHQDIWGLKLGKDLSHKQIADTLGITENNVNVILFRSLKTIKKKFFASKT